MRWPQVWALPQRKPSRFWETNCQHCWRDIRRNGKKGPHGRWGTRHHKLGTWSPLLRVKMRAKQKLAAFPPRVSRCRSAKILGSKARNLPKGEFLLALLDARAQWEGASCPVKDLRTSRASKGNGLRGSISGGDKELWSSTGSPCPLCFPGMCVEYKVPVFMHSA